MRKCFICNSFEPTQLLFSNKDSHIVRCKKCGLIYDDCLKFIESEMDDVYSDGENGHYPSNYVQRALMGGRKPLKLELMKNIRNFISHPEGKKFLDIGCSVGDFLEIVSNNGFEIFGLDISKNACGIARDRNKDAQIFAGEIFDAHYPSNYFDIVNISAVLVHTKDPRCFIDEVYRILKPGGFLFIDDASYEFFRFYNFICKLLFHEDKNYKYFLNFFTLNTFSKFVATIPFRLLKIFPYYYSDELSKSYFKPFQNKTAIKFLLKFIRIIKIDKILGKARLFQVVLIK